MKYVPNLIPETSRVTQFEGFNQPYSLKKPGWWLVLSYMGSIVFLLGGLGNIFSRFWEGFFFLILGLVLLPGVHNELEQRLRFTFTWLIKTLFCVTLIGITVTISNSYDKEEQLAKAVLEGQRAQTAFEQEKERIKAEEKTQARKDSLDKYLSLAKADIKSHHFSTAVYFFDKALFFADTGEASIINERAGSYFKAGKYEQSLTDYTTLIEADEEVSANLYQRALCYEKLGNRQEAVNDLKDAIALGNEKAEQLYERINPLKRRVSYYVTRCCDGSTSSATGRGACSHHRGVCKWNDPVYETYRKY
jgi:tetratricopeptide (TPR) repeat protein